MKRQLLALAIFEVGILLHLQVSAQGTFRNMGFEEATLPYLPPGQSGDRVSASNALPGWTIYGGYTYPDVLFNDEALDSASISILSTNYSGVVPGLASGTYYVHLKGASFPPYGTASIGQTGQVPTSAATVLLDAAYIFPPAVYLGGVYIPLVQIAPKGDYAFVYGGDVSAFAGQVAELRLSGSWFDNIRFSSQPIPEPNIIALLSVALGLYRCCPRKLRL